MASSAVSSFPCSVRSLFHGVSLFIGLSVLLGCFVGLWQISQFQSYAGNHNECFVTNSAAFYYGDNVLYCPNAHVVSSIEILDPYHAVWAETIEDVSSYKDLETIGTISTYNYTTSIYIDDDDQNCWWYYNMNPGSVVHMTFTDIHGDGLQVQIDDEDWEDLDPTKTSQSFTFTTTEDNDPRGYKLEVYATNETMKGTYQGEVMFQYDMTYFTAPPGAGNISRFDCTDVPRSSCSWELDFDTNICISMWYPGSHYFGNNWDGACVTVNQLGRPKWSAVLIPSAFAIILLLLVVNLACILLVKFKRKRDFQDDFMQPLDTFSKGDEPTDNIEQKHTGLELSDEEDW